MDRQVFVVMYKLKDMAIADVLRSTNWRLIQNILFCAYHFSNYIMQIHCILIWPSHMLSSSTSATPPVLFTGAICPNIYNKQKTNNNLYCNDETIQQSVTHAASTYSTQYQTINKMFIFTTEINITQVKYKIDQTFARCLSMARIPLEY